MLVKNKSIPNFFKEYAYNDETNFPGYHTPLHEINWDDLSPSFFPNQFLVKKTFKESFVTFEYSPDKIIHDTQIVYSYEYELKEYDDIQNQMVLTDYKVKTVPANK